MSISSPIGRIPAVLFARTGGTALMCDHMTFNTSHVFITLLFVWFYSALAQWAFTYCWSRIVLKLDFKSFLYVENSLKVFEICDNGGQRKRWVRYMYAVAGFICHSLDLWIYLLCWWFAQNRVWILCALSITFCLPWSGRAFEFFSRLKS